MWGEQNRKSIKQWDKITGKTEEGADPGPSASRTEQSSTSPFGLPQSDVGIEVAHRHPGPLVRQGTGTSNPVWISINVHCPRELFLQELLCSWCKSK